MKARTFPCDSCGLCCRKIGMIPGFEEFDDGNGTCIHLNEYHQCSIYETRPLYCRITEGYDILFASEMSWDEYVLSNSAVCQTLKKEASDGTHTY
ncbi:YkgJ family cysteine cluster protein [Exiguobacterium sp. s6]|uniref:YkgJ family cysteine cluster protein n=1 Tax=Exiguobacterium sp. s6 TaxID=2751236 RepID=UPI00333BAD43